MSATELKQFVDQSTPEERQFLRSYLSQAYPEDDTFDGAELDRRMRDLDGGRGRPWNELLARHEELKAKGE